MTMHVPVPVSLPGLPYPFPTVLWMVGDVREARPDLTDRQAWEVFKFAETEQDARIGLTWDLLMYAAESLYGPAAAGRRQ